MYAIFFRLGNSSYLILFLRSKIAVLRRDLFGGTVALFGAMMFTYIVSVRVNCDLKTLQRPAYFTQDIRLNCIGSLVQKLLRRPAVLIQVRRAALAVD